MIEFSKNVLDNCRQRKSLKHGTQSLVDTIVLKSSNEDRFNAGTRHHAKLSRH